MAEWECEWCNRKHSSEFSRTCGICNFLLMSGGLNECAFCEQFYDTERCTDCHEKMRRDDVAVEHYFKNFIK